MQSSHIRLITGAGRCYNSFMIKRVAGIYFSPAGGAALMTQRLAGDIGAILDDCSPEDVSVEYFDLLKDHGSIELDDETIAVIGMPVYVGKIPLPAAAAVHSIAGKGALTIAAVSYGGRSYGNALFELKNLVEDCGFRMIGAGAFMLRYMAVRGSARSSMPAMDIEAMADFTKAASAKIRRLGGCEIEELKIKPAPVEVDGRMPVHLVSRLSPAAAATAQKVLEKLSFRRHESEWFL